MSSNDVGRRATTKGMMISEAYFRSGVPHVELHVSLFDAPFRVASFVPELLCIDRVVAFEEVVDSIEDVTEEIDPPRHGSPGHSPEFVMYYSRISL